MVHHGGATYRRGTERINGLSARVPTCMYRPLTLSVWSWSNCEMLITEDIAGGIPDQDGVEGDRKVH